LQIREGDLETDYKIGYFSFFCKGQCEGVVAEHLNAKAGEMQDKHIKMIEKSLWQKTYQSHKQRSEGSGKETRLAP